MDGLADGDSVPGLFALADGLGKVVTGLGAGIVGCSDLGAVVAWGLSVELDELPRTPVRKRTPTVIAMAATTNKIHAQMGTPPPDFWGTCPPFQPPCPFCELYWGGTYLPC